MFVTYNIEKNPSARVLNSYLIDNLSNLMNDKMKLYIEAVKIVKRDWNVEKVGGNNHVWNTIEFGDGKIYCLDESK